MRRPHRDLDGHPRPGVSTRAIDSVILLARVVHGTDYHKRGRSVADLGLENLTIAEIQHYVDRGDLPDRS